MGYIHGQNIERCFSFGGLVQFGHDQVQAISAFEITVSFFNGVTGADILAYLSGLLGTCVHLLGPPQGWTSHANTVFCAISVVLQVLVDVVGKDSFWVASKLAAVLFHYCLEITSLVVITPARLLQICVAVYDR